MDMNWLRDFECLARTLNFTRASNERNITQSAFSRRIKALENWVGLPSIRDADRGDSRFIRISVLHTIAVNFLATRIGSLEQQMPDLRIRVVSDSLSTCCELLVEGAVDILLCYYHHSVSPMIDEAAFARRDLLTDRLIPVAATGPARDVGIPGRRVPDAI